MSFKNTTLKDYYLLKDRESLSIDPWRDRDQFFGARELNKRILKRIESDFVQPRSVPKFFVHGSYGSGKTHTLAHIEYVLKKNELYPTEPIYIDIAPLTAKERFEKIHGRLLDAIGLDRIRVAAETTADRIPAQDKVQGFLASGALEFGDQALKTSQANIFRNLLFGGRQAQMSWEWLKGRKTSVDEAQTLGTQKQLADAQDFVFCLLNIGALFYLGCKRKIVFLIDEAEAFRSVTHPDSQTELKHAIRLILENANRYVGCILAIQVEGGQEGIGDFFTSDDIRRRVDYDQGFIDLNGMVAGVENAQKFMEEMLSYLINQKSAANTIQTEDLGTTETYFPFTQDAIEALSKHIVANQERALPAAIISWMSNAAIEAWRRREESSKHRLVTADIVEETIFPEG
ncbi:MAG: hypothetical protein WA639_13765 [Candidatus Acidiferrum sp.]